MSESDPERFDSYRGMKLDAFQSRALAAIARRESVFVAAPTGAGKTVIAEYALERALAQGKKIIYTAPIKALSNQKFRDFSALYPGRIGVTTGDVAIRPDAPAVIMTTEIFRNTIFESPHRLDDVDYVVYDEVHYMDDRERGTVWEESLIFAPEQIRIIALSATVSNLHELCDWIRVVRPGPLEVIVETHRPVPLEIFIADIDEGIHPFSPGSLHEVSARQRNKRRHEVGSIGARYARAHRQLVKDVRARGELPCLFFLFSRSACERLADDAAQDDFFRSEQDRKAALAAFDGLVDLYKLDTKDFTVRSLRRLMHNGVTYHHAGLLPVLKEIIEQLFSLGHVRFLCATETFAIGVNMPARSVAFEGLKKFNGRMRVPMQTRQFLQMAGRAGRRGMDASGSVYVTYDPIVDDPRLARSVIAGQIEPVQSQFNLSYSTLINLYSHLGERIFLACERSFGFFSAARQRANKPKHEKDRRSRFKDKKRQGRDHHHKRHQDSNQPTPEVQTEGPQLFSNMLSQVEARLALLDELGYINRKAESGDDRLSAKGRFAALIYGRELAATELVEDGCLDSLSPEQLAVVFTALVYESRPDSVDSSLDPKTVIGSSFRSIQKILKDLALKERRHGLTEGSVFADWKLTAAVWSWAKGGQFEEIRELTGASDGDLVRTLRQAMQLMRMVGYPLKSERDPLRQRTISLGQRLLVAIDLLKRDLVDAEWQMRVREEEALAAPAPATESPTELKVSAEAISGSALEKRSRWAAARGAKTRFDEPAAPLEESAPAQYREKRPHKAKKGRHGDSRSAAALDPRPARAPERRGEAAHGGYSKNARSQDSSLEDSSLEDSSLEDSGQEDSLGTARPQPKASEASRERPPSGLSAIAQAGERLGRQNQRY